jgi:hypothetical protein
LGHIHRNLIYRPAHSLPKFQACTDFVQLPGKPMPQEEGDRQYHHVKSTFPLPLNFKLHNPE